jgi:hypothetical protein
MVQPSRDTQIIQELVYYAGSRFRLIILAMKKPQNDPQKQQEWMGKCLRQELVCNHQFIIWNSFRIIV